MITHARTVASLILVAMATSGCSTSEIAGAYRLHDRDGAMVPSAALSSYTPPKVLTDIPHAPLKTMGGAYASTQWADTPENILLLQEMIAAGITPETIHTTTNHLQRTMSVTATCGADRTTSVSHDTWCDYALDNRNDEPYRVSASTLHQYRHTTGGLLSRTSVSQEREYRPSTVDTIARKDSTQDPTGPTAGTDPRGGGDSGGSTWTICWEYYELDLVSGEVTLLFTTCPVSPGGQTQSVSPTGEAVRARRDIAREPRLVGASALLVQVPALPNGAKIVVRRTGGEEPQFLILGVADASDSDWAGGIEIVKAVVRRDDPDAAPAAFALGRTAGKARPELRAQAASLRMRMQAANRRAIPGFGVQRAVPLTLFVER